MRTAVGEPQKFVRRRLSAPRKRPQQRLLQIAAITAVLLTAWIIAGVWLFVVPATDPPTRSDVLFVLGPPDERIDYAEELMQRGAAGTLAVSSPVGQDGQFTAPICKAVQAYPIICFHPDPFTTQGEARALQALSQQHGWNRVNVLTAQHHVTRARVIIDRCYKGELGIIEYVAELPLTAWPYLFTYHTAAFVKVALNPDC